MFKKVVLKATNSNDGTGELIRYIITKYDNRPEFPAVGYLVVDMQEYEADAPEITIKNIDCTDNTNSCTNYTVQFAGIEQLTDTQLLDLIK